MTIVHAMVDTASIDVELDTHQLNEVVANAVAEALGKVAGADFVATLDSRIIKLEEIIESIETFQPPTGLVDSLNKDVARLAHNLTHCSQRVSNLEAEERGLKSIAIKNLIRRIAELEDSTEIQRLNERVDGFCFVEDRRDEAETERMDVIDKLHKRVSRLEGTEAKWTSRINQDPTKHVPMIQEGHIVHTCNNMGTDKEEGE